MADKAIVPFDSRRANGSDTISLGPPVDFDVRGLERQLPRNDAPEGWIRKIDRRREGRVWFGFFHLWTTDPNGRRFSRNGGFVFNTIHNVQARTPAQNIVAMLGAVHEFNGGRMATS